MPFEPHVTLLGGISLPRSLAIERTAALAGSLRPFAVRLGGAGHEAAFFRCLYLRAAGSGLRGARALAERTLSEGAIRRRLFRPHLSLVYGRLAPADRRTLAKECLGEPDLTFTARRIALVRTTGHPRTWRMIASRRLAVSLRVRRAGLS
jgi:2'-5' RNA ligase